MKYSAEALKVLAGRELGHYETKAQFWKLAPNPEQLNQLICEEAKTIEIKMHALLQNLEQQGITGMICAFDPEFPAYSESAPNGERPSLLFYRGDISLLKKGRRVAVIGETGPAADIENREKTIVNELLQKDVVIVSGLAKGCDRIAHACTLEAEGKTIAILPSTIGKIIPAENRKLAEEIVSKGGLLLTEYAREPASAYEQTSRYIERDHLQALFSKAVVMIASYRKGEGDSGSRHAMEAAWKYGGETFVMYDEKTDRGEISLGLNQYYYESKRIPKFDLDAVLNACPGEPISLFD